MGKTNTITMTVYKPADNDLGYEKKFIDAKEAKFYVADGWLLSQLEAIEDDTFTIEKATKAQLIEHAKENYGVDLDKTKKVDDLRQEVTDLGTE